MVKDCKIEKSDDEWREQLSDQEFQVTRCSATERAFTGRYWNEKAAGTYHCVCCGAPLFRSEAKFDSGTGWPSFHSPRSPRRRRRQGRREPRHGADRIGLRPAATPIWATSSPTVRSRRACATA